MDNSATLPDEAYKVRTGKTHKAKKNTGSNVNSATTADTAGSKVDRNRYNRAKDSTPKPKVKESELSNQESIQKESSVVATDVDVVQSEPKFRTSRIRNSRLPIDYIDAIRREWINKHVKQIEQESHGACYNDSFRYPQKELVDKLWAFSLPAFLRLIHPRHTAEVIRSPEMKTTLILNAGLWGNEFQTREYADEVYELGNKIFDQFIWKTTSRSKCLNIVDQEENCPHDSKMCERTGANCLNLSWTRLLPPELSWDCVHFYAPVYNLINDQLMDMLR